MKKIIISLLPFGLVNLILSKRREVAKKNNLLLKEMKIHQLYTKRDKVSSKLNLDLEEFYNCVISDLVEKGLDEDQVRAGSMPFKSLLAVKNIIDKNFSNSTIIALHVGNFVGVSLAFFTKSILDSCKQNSLVISIDPNLTHRGISNPMEYSNYLLGKYNLDKNSLVVCGYSLDKSVSNDGENYDEKYNPFEKFENENAPQNVLENLWLVRRNFIDLVLIDGNHEVSYLENEINKVSLLMRDTGIIILDDIDPVHWKDLFDLFEKLDRGQYRVLFTDNRIAVIQKVK